MLDLRESLLNAKGQNLTYYIQEGDPSEADVPSDASQSQATPHRIEDRLDSDDEPYHTSVHIELNELDGDDTGEADSVTRADAVGSQQDGVGMQEASLLALRDGIIKEIKQQLEEQNKSTTPSPARGARNNFYEDD